MRIPRYRSNVQLTTDAPGRPMTARMRAGPIVNAIEGKANVFNAALQQVNEYAVQRQKMINEQSVTKLYSVQKKVCYRLLIN